MDRYEFYEALKINSESIAHSGVKGMRWGYRRWTNEDGTLNEAGRRRYGVGTGLGYQNRITYEQAHYTGREDLMSHYHPKDKPASSVSTGSSSKKKSGGRSKGSSRSKSGGSYASTTPQAPLSPVYDVETIQSPSSAETTASPPTTVSTSSDFVGEEKDITLASAHLERMNARYSAVENYNQQHPEGPYMFVDADDRIQMTNELDLAMDFNEEYSRVTIANQQKLINSLRSPNAG